MRGGGGEAGGVVARERVGRGEEKERRRWRGGERGGKY